MRVKSLLNTTKFSRPSIDECVRPRILSSSFEMLSARRFRETICSRESNASELNTINKQLVTFKYYEVFIFVEFVVK
ncbi:hypothetical protein HZH66_012884 [Vespula vulgaris]|uniref:Uncharacterized protein n=1 Tax=Vespula vulgaris TaxID=7454 RepID=A0A834JAQ4_VESVU|nr:hypothetical protein HZH66_012884 [Vespula vulgaris]